MSTVVDEISGENKNEASCFDFSNQIHSPHNFQEKTLSCLILVLISYVNNTSEGNICVLCLIPIFYSKGNEDITGEDLCGILDPYRHNDVFYVYGDVND